MSPSREMLNELKKELDAAQLEVQSAEGGFAATDTDAAWQRVKRARDDRDRLDFKVKSFETVLEREEEEARIAAERDLRREAAEAIKAASSDAWRKSIEPHVAKLARAFSECIDAMGSICDATSDNQDLVTRANELNYRLPGRNPNAGDPCVPRNYLAIAWAVRTTMNATVTNRLPERAVRYFGSEDKVIDALRATGALGSYRESGTEDIVRIVAEAVKR